MIQISVDAHKSMYIFIYKGSVNTCYPGDFIAPNLNIIRNAVNNGFSFIVT